MSNAGTDFRAPWERYPEIPCNSIRWRLGHCDDAMNDWWNAMRSLTHEQRLSYRQQHTGPEEWIQWMDWVLDYLQKEER